MSNFTESKLYKKVVPKRTQEIISSAKREAQRRQAASSGGSGNAQAPMPPSGPDLMYGGNVGDPLGIANQMNRPPQIKQPDNVPSYNYNTGRVEPPKRTTYSDPMKTLPPNILEQRTGFELLEGRKTGGYDFPPGSSIKHSDTYARFTAQGPWYNITPAFNIPTQIKEAGSYSSARYRDLSLSFISGGITEDRFQYEMNRDIMEDLTSGTEKPDVDWMKKYGSFSLDGQVMSYSDLEKKMPGLDLKRTDKGFETVIDTNKWMSAQPGYVQTIGGFLGAYANPDYIISGFTGNPADPTYVKSQTAKLGQIKADWTYNESKLVSEKNYLFAALNVPVVQNVLVPAGMGFATKTAFKGAQMASQAFMNAGRPAVAKTISYGTTAFSAGIGAVAVKSVADDIYRTYQDNSDNASRKILQYGIQFSSLYAGTRSQPFPKTSSNISTKYQAFLKQNIKPVNIKVFSKGYVDITHRSPTGHTKFTYDSEVRIPGSSKGKVTGEGFSIQQPKSQGNSVTYFRGTLSQQQRTGFFKKTAIEQNLQSITHSKPYETTYDTGIISKTFKAMDKPVTTMTQGKYAINKSVTNFLGNEPSVYAKGISKTMQIDPMNYEANSYGFFRSTKTKGRYFDITKIADISDVKPSAPNINLAGIQSKIFTAATSSKPSVTTSGKNLVSTMSMSGSKSSATTTVKNIMSPRTTSIQLSARVFPQMNMPTSISGTTGGYALYQSFMYPGSTLQHGGQKELSINRSIRSPVISMTSIEGMMGKQELAMVNTMQTNISMQPRLMAQSSSSGFMTESDMFSSQKTDIAQMQMQAQQLRPSQTMSMASQSYAAANAYASRISSESLLAVPRLPRYGLYGRGTSGYGDSSLMPRYLFREFKLPSLKEAIKGVKLKI